MQRHGLVNIQMISRIVLLILNISISSCLKNEESKTRQKRILWVTQDGRLALPPGTTMVITPSLSLPFVRYPPDGFFSNMTISLPFTIDFNKLGLTDNENPYGIIPPYLARSMGRAAGSFLADYIGKLLDRRTSNRSKRSEIEPLPSQFSNALHGGERAVLYVLVEEMLENFGMNGRACLLRAICEVHANPLTNFGLVGEMLKLFLSASKSPYADLLSEYVKAEYAGSGKHGSPSECWPYMKDCPKSLFLRKHTPYSEMDVNEIPNNSKEDRKYDSEVTLNPILNM